MLRILSKIGSLNSRQKELKSSRKINKQFTEGELLKLQTHEDLQTYWYFEKIMQDYLDFVWKKCILTSTSC